MTRTLIAALAVLFATVSMSATAEPAGPTPQATLDAYFKVLTSRNVDDISELMASGSMSRLKTLMVDAIQQEKSGGTASLQRRFFGKAVSMEEVRKTPASFFLDEIAHEILNAAEMQHFFVDDRRIIGTVDESDDMVHVVVRLFLHQDARRNSDILVYTLIREGDIWKLDFPPTIRQALAVLEAALRQ